MKSFDEIITEAQQRNECCLGCAIELVCSDIGFKAEEDGETEAAEFVFESLKDDTMEYARNKGISLGVHWD
jgi:hypothetical protein